MGATRGAICGWGRSDVDTEVGMSRSSVDLGALSWVELGSIWSWFGGDLG